MSRRAARTAAALGVVGCGIAALLWLGVFAPATAPREGRAAARPTDRPPAPDASAARATAEDPAAALERRDPHGELRLIGRLATADGTPLPDDVRLHATDGLRDVAATIEGDRYTLAPLRPGRWTLDVTATGFVDLRVDHQVTADSSEGPLLLLARARRVEVMVRTPDGDRLAAASTAPRLAWALSVAPFESPLRGSLPPAFDWWACPDSKLLRAKGHPDDPAVDAVLWLPHRPVFVALRVLDTLVEQQAVAPDQSRVTFVVPARTLEDLLGSIRLRLIDARTGAPLREGIGVRTAMDVNTFADGKPNALGEVHLKRVPPGRVTVSFDSVGGRAEPFLAARVMPGATVDLGDVLVEPARNVAITASLPDSTPWHIHADARVRVSPIDADPWIAARSVGPYLGSPADYGFDGLPSRPLVVRIDDPARGLTGYRQIPEHAAPEHADREHVDLLPAGAVVIDAPGAIRAGWIASLRDADRVPVAVDFAGRWTERYRLRAPPGGYSAEIHDPASRLVRRFAVTIRAGEVTILQLD